MEQRREAMFRSSLPWTGKATETVVISCSDHRFQAHFDQFIRDGLKIDSFGRFALPGGPQFLLAADVPMFEKAGRRWVKFLTRNVGIQQIICLAHEDCLWYKDITVGHFTLPLLKERQMGDLRKARLVLQEMFPRVSVRIFYADTREDNKIPFVEFFEIH
jgi:hypothetical protein